MFFIDSRQEHRQFLCDNLKSDVGVAGYLDRTDPHPRTRLTPALHNQLIQVLMWGSTPALYNQLIWRLLAGLNRGHAGLIGTADSRDG
ncbi:hypothetical protein AAFF_G00110240 [Aldrovandia affinis]|uniref:Uncharacterized protein n=1 Tax=Aldrovandia affinis TaxID=143900 RepID=A0AAD7WB65_9TELE|nr:hypothetical protein AAFF_G00110240 [Aldrovandia affinis]